MARQTEEFPSIDNEPVENNLYMKNDAFTQTKLDKRDDLIKLLMKKNEELVAKQSILQGKLIFMRNCFEKSRKKPFYRELLTSNKNALFYAGLSNLDLFESVHNLVMPLIRRKWVGNSKSYEIKRKFKKLPNRLVAKPK